MIAGLEAANRYLSKNHEIYIYHPGGGERGLIRIPRIQKQSERTIIREIKKRVIKKWGIVDLLDILIEADRQINFLRFFHTSGQRQVLSQMAARKRLILNLFSLGPVARSSKFWQALIFLGFYKNVIPLVAVRFVYIRACLHNSAWS